MKTLHQIFDEFKIDFAASRKGQERSSWFALTLLAVIMPFSSSRTSNLLRCIQTVFGETGISRKRFYTFMASPKIPWDKLWPRVWKMIPDPLVNGRLTLVVDDYINPKTGTHIFGCDHFFDHAAKKNQSSYPWAQNIVALGLLKKIKGRWASLPLAFRFYLMSKTVDRHKEERPGMDLEFKTKFVQTQEMIVAAAKTHPDVPVVAVVDSWFGNDGLWSPTRKVLGDRFHMVSRLRSNQNLFALPEPISKKGPGRPKKYGEKLGSVTDLAMEKKPLAKECRVDLYGKSRNVIAFEQIFMLKNIKAAAKVVWVYRKSTWIAMFSTDLNLSAREIIELYGARWKIEAFFKELKRDIGSAATQTRHPQSVSNHLNFCMMAVSLIWIVTCHAKETPTRRHAVEGRKHFAFSDARLMVAKTALDADFGLFCSQERKPAAIISILQFLRLAA
jgi:hypothetical protein